VAACAFVVIASLLVPLGLVTVWIREQILDTNTFVSTAGSLAHDPAVQREVSDKVSTALIRQLDVGSNVPNAASSLSGPLSAAADTSIRTATAAVVASGSFQQLWETAVRGAQENALKLAKGEPVAGVQTRNGRVAVNLDPVVDAVVAQLPGPIAARIPPATTNDDIVLFKSSDLASAQPVMRALDDGWWAVPLLCIALFAAAVAIESRRRRALVWVGGGIVISSSLTFVALLVGRADVLDGLDTGVSDAAARAIVDALLDPLRTELWVTLGVGVALTAGALIVGFLAHASPIAAPTEGLVSETPALPLPGTEPTIAERAAMPTPDRTSGQPAEPARQTTGTPGTSI
jgi:hypothetical protein